MNPQNDLVATITVPMGQPSGSTIPFTGISIAENDALDGELMFLLFIEGFSFAQTSGGGIFGFITVTVDDDDDSKFYEVRMRRSYREHARYAIHCRNGLRPANEGVNRVFNAKFYC